MSTGDPTVAIVRQGTTGITGAIAVTAIVIPITTRVVSRGHLITALTRTFTGMM